MDPKTPAEGPERFDPGPFLSFSEILRSLLWRFYDEAFFLVLVNLAWVGSCWAFLLLFPRLSFLSHLPPWGWVALDLFVVSVLSVGGASAVFSAMNAGRPTLTEVRAHFLRFGPKATALSVLFGVGTGLGFLDLRFLWAHPLVQPWIGYAWMAVVAWGMVFWSLMGFYLWPVLFFQDPPVLRVFYKAFLLAWDSFFPGLLYLAFFSMFSALFTLFWPLWFLGGASFLFSFQCIVLEKRYLKYRIFFKGLDAEQALRKLERERDRNWREFLRPWETK